MATLNLGADAIERLLERAAEHCAALGVQLTPQRRLALRLLLEAPAPLGAYDLLERVAAATGRSVAPITIYRLLDFLVMHGLAHRIERRNAFVACAAPEPGTGSDRMAGHQFLLCRQCGSVTEFCDTEFARRLAAAAAQRGFHALGTATIEVEGLCPHCSEPAESVSSGSAHSAI